MRIQKLSRIQKLLAAAAMAFLASAGTASANSVDLSSFSVSYGSVTSGTTTDVSFSNYLTTPYQPSLPSSATDLFTANPAGTCTSCGASNTASGTITVSFTFTAPVATTITEYATYQAKYGGTALS